jgi:serine phosphatase RsbU (regulator of sigma subunit)
MLVDLRDRLQAHGAMPELPAGWLCDVAISSASRSSSKFSGDFLVAATDHGSRVLEVALVDVSGKGVEAGTRALLLSGALGGLLGSVAPEEFLPAANAYLLRQAWHEGFATAVHLVLDLDTGEYLLDSAGHPPAAQFDAGSGRWRLADVEGTVLGLEPKPSYVAERGVMRSGDAVLLYTDGVVETPGRDLALGIDKLLGEAERLISRGFGGGARWLIEKASPSRSDDRAVVLIHRS